MVIHRRHMQTTRLLFSSKIVLLNIVIRTCVHPKMKFKTFACNQTKCFSLHLSFKQNLLRQWWHHWMLWQTNLALIEYSLCNQFAKAGHTHTAVFTVCWLNKKKPTDLYNHTLMGMQGSLPLRHCILAWGLPPMLECTDQHSQPIAASADRMLVFQQVH